MKKIIILIVILLLATGCKKDKNVFCKYENTGDGLKVVNTLEAEIKNNKVVNATAKMVYDNEETANTMCKIFGVASDSSTVECNGKEIIVKDYHKVISNETLTREDLIEYAKQNNYTCDE